MQVVLVDSQEAPLLEDGELPQGVESVVQVTEEQAEAGRGLLFQQVTFQPASIKVLKTCLSRFGGILFRPPHYEKERMKKKKIDEQIEIKPLQSY